MPIWPAVSEEKAQALYLVAALMFVLIGMAALSIDIGYALHGQRELQASADAAATAGAQILSQNVSATQAEAAATQYSGMQGAYNQINDLMSVKMPINTVRCLNTLVTTLGLTCDDVADANAVAVEETAQAPTFFGKIFGIQSINLTAYSMAGIQGGTLIPANIMVIMDTTASMQDPDSDATCVAESGVSSPSKEDCAKWGVRTFLNLLNPVRRASHPAARSPAALQPAIMSRTRSTRLPCWSSRGWHQLPRTPHMTTTAKLMRLAPAMAPSCPTARLVPPLLTSPLFNFRVITRPPTQAV